MAVSAEGPWRSLPFAILETEPGDPGDAVLAVARDELAFTICRGFLSPAELETIRETTERLTGDARVDFVPGFVRGAYHYLKPIQDYLQNCAQENPLIEQFVAATPVSRLFHHLSASATASGLGFRRAQSGTSPLSAGVIRQWGGEGDFSLRAHEDWSQLGHPAQAELEFSAVAPTVAGVNLCLRNDDAEGNAGAIMLWNRRVEVKEGHAVGERRPWSGYPFEPNDLRDAAMAKIPIRAGDLYCVNGRYVHAVASGPVLGAKPRVNFSIVIGIHPNGDLLYWA